MGGWRPSGPHGVGGDAPCATNLSMSACSKCVPCWHRTRVSVFGVCACVGSEADVTRKYDQRKRFQHICYEDVLFNHSPHRTRRDFALQFIQPHCAGTPHLMWSESPNNFSCSMIPMSSGYDTIKNGRWAMATATATTRTAAAQRRRPLRRWRW